MKQEYLLLFAVLVFAVGSRIATLATAWSRNPECVMAPDSYTYEGPAFSLLLAGRFASNPNQPEIPECTRTPVYPLFIAKIYAVAGRSRLAVLVVQIFVSAGVIWLAWLISRRLWNPRAALATAILLALDPVSFLYAQMFLTETLFTFFLVLAAWFGLLWLDKQERRGLWATLCGLAVALTALIRPISFYLIFPVAFYMVVVEWRRCKSWRAIRYAVLALLPWLILAGGWWLRNYHVAGVGTISEIQDYNLLFYRAAGAVALRDNIPLEAAQEKIRRSLPATKGWPAADVHKLYRREASAIFRSHPGPLLRSTVDGVYKTLLGPAGGNLRRLLGLPVRMTGPVQDFLNLPLGTTLRRWVVERPLQLMMHIYDYYLFSFVFYGAVAVGLWSLRNVEHPAPASHGFLWLVLLYMIAVSAGPEAYGRFRVPLVPLFAVYAGRGLTALPFPSGLRSAG